MADLSFVPSRERRLPVQPEPSTEPSTLAPPESSTKKPAEDESQPGFKRRKLQVQETLLIYCIYFIVL
jgi:hypothetical protein